MEEKLREWNGYNIIDAILVLIGIITVTVTSILFSSPWYIILNTILGLLCVFTQAKGKVITQFLGIAYFSMYSIISYTQRYYGEAIVYIFMMIPMYIYGAIHWLMNRDKKENTVLVRNELSKKEVTIGLIAMVIISIIIYKLLELLDTAHIMISTLSFVTVMPAIYLLARRCKWNQVAFLINDFIVPILWILLVIEGQLVFIPMCIYHIFQITYDFYGLIEWTKLEKKQKLENKL